MANDPKIDYDAASVAADALADEFDSGGSLKFYTVGSGIPTNADDAITDQTELVDITLPSPAFGAAANGVASKSGTWSGTCSASGTPAFFRFTVGSVTYQGTAGIDTGTFDVEFDDDTWLSGGSVVVSAFDLTVPRE